LLAVIRSHFEHIHRSIPKLEAVEKVPVPGNAKATVGYRHLCKLEEQGVEEHWVENADHPIRVRDLLNGYETREERAAHRDREGMPQKMTQIVVKDGGQLIMKGDDMKQAGRDINELSISGGTINAPVAIQQMLQNSFNTIQQATDEELKPKLETLHGQVAQLMATLDEKQQAEAKENLEALVNEATRPEPRKKWYELSKDGLIEAAQTVKELAGPITATVTEIGKLLFTQQ
jgi:hypothetical protein